MTFEKKNSGYLLAFIIIGAILGSAIGTFITGIIPGASIITKSLTGPIGFNLEIISFHLNLNVAAIFGLVTGIIIFFKL